MARARPSRKNDRQEMPDASELLGRARNWASILLEGTVVYFPVRHHSPACALHLEKLIDELRPEVVIIEGPCSMDRWVSSLTSAECIAPIAILTSYREANEPGANRHSAFYPLCDYSPELLAVRKGKEIGARVRFADLEFADKVRFQQQWFGQGEASASMLGVLLADESNLRHGRFIENLVRRMGCRDFDELWDHLFESRGDDWSTEQFVGTLATYCDLSRASHDPEHLKGDATLAREAVMAKVINAEQSKIKHPRRGSILVVTGGFHTVALPAAVAGEAGYELPKLPEVDASLVGSWLIRYSFNQLDALSGYRSGMPHPGFYEALWQADRSGVERRVAVARLITSIARRTRGQAIRHEASVTDSINALWTIDQLAALRGHTVPTRSDLLDAIANSMRKESSGQRDLLDVVVQQVLAGDQIGAVPAGVGQPPIIEDFQRTARQHRLPVDTIEPRGVKLELYRKPAHRRVSFLLHQLVVLDVPYATLTDGPDFVHGHRLWKLDEQWESQWSPSTDAALTEAAMLGDTVASAAMERLKQLLAALEDDGAARNAGSAVDCLIRACRCGLHQLAQQILMTVHEHMREDGVFASVANGLSRLALLRSAREPLEATRLERLDEIVVASYQRAIYLIDSLVSVPDDQVESSLDGLLVIRELLVDIAASSVDSKTELRLDAELFEEALLRLIRVEGMPSRGEIAGAAAGMLHGIGRIDEHRVCEVVRWYLSSAIADEANACGVIQGLMMVAREAFWRMDDLLRELSAQFEIWEEQRFVAALPQLRLAFSQLAPKEVDLVADRVAKLHQVDELGTMIHPDVTEDDLQLAAQATRLMLKSLDEDGLR